MSTSTVGTVTSTGYLYDKAGMRLTQGDTSSTMLYVSPAYNAMFDASSTQIDVQKHVSVGAQAIATIQGTGGAARALFSHTDHLSGASVVTDASGAVEERIDYLPYGSIRSDEKVGAWSEQRKFAGHEFDDKSGYSYMQARYYDPVVGRFLNVDPAFRDLSFRLEDPQSMNSYAYARNNPIGYIDPDGRVAQLAPLLLAAVIIYAPMAGLAIDNPGLVTEAALRTAPGSGDVIDVREALSGRDSFTGQDLSFFERGVTAAAAAVPIIPGKALRAGSKVVKEGADVVQGAGAKISKALNSGPYSSLQDSASVKPGGRFTPKQKADIYRANMERNGGVLRSDLDGQELILPKKSMSGIHPPSNEAQIDHISSRNPANPNMSRGTNSYGNAQVLSRQQNRIKSNR